MTWTDERIDELTRLWQAGHSASEIGKRLAVSKNAVVGKAHRLKLPSRPSPIKQQELDAGGQPNASARKRTRSRRAVPSQPAAGRASAAEDVLSAPSQEQSAPATERGGATARSAVAASRVGSGDTRKSAAKVATQSNGRTARQAGRATAGSTGAEAQGSSSGCLWPIGDPGDSDFHFCGAQAVPGKPYCAEHAARAYITRSRSHAGEEAA